MLELPEAKVLVRRGEAGDLAFVFDTWLQNYRLSKQPQLMQGPLYYREQRQLVDRILRRPGAAIAVAADPEDAAHVFGWIVAEHPDVPELLLVHYAYVKQRFRGFGIFKAMLGAVRAGNETLVATHFPPPDKLSLAGGGEALLRKIGAVFNPYASSR